MVIAIGKFEFVYYMFLSMLLDTIHMTSTSSTSVELIVSASRLYCVIMMQLICYVFFATSVSKVTVFHTLLSNDDELHSFLETLHMSQQLFLRPPLTKVLDSASLCPLSTSFHLTLP